MTNYKDFIIEMLHANADSGSFKVSELKPTSIDWQKMAEDVDESKMGDYTLNPDTEKFTAKDFASFASKGKIGVVFEGNGNIFNAASNIIAAHAKDSHFPGLEFAKWAVENPDQVPPELKDNKIHALLGSLYRETSGQHSGGWYIFYLTYNADQNKVKMFTSALKEVWNGTYEAVVIKK